MKRILLSLLAISLALPVFAGGPKEAKLIKSHKRIPGQYIVVLEDRTEHVPDVAADIVRMNRGRLGYVYEHAIKGFSASLSEAAAVAIAHRPDVKYVEEDGTVSIDTTQSPVTWGLDRIDQRNLPLSNSYTYTATGSGVKAYIIDTGINTAHVDFGGRAIDGTDAVDGSLPAADCNGHGTHVSGTVGGNTYGVAKGVTLVAVRVLDCSGNGTDSGVIAGVNWVTSDHAAGQPAVANMSLGGGISQALDDAVNAAINDGVTFAVAAGNGDQFGNPLNACDGSPSRVANAITVSATNSSDAKQSWANYGTCVDLFAPGISITSDWYSSNTATNTISGTSMATPHVAGVAAMYLSTNTSASPATVTNAIISNATTGVVTSAGTGSPNRLLYMGFIGGTPPPPPPPGGQLFLNAGFESGATVWTTTAGVIDSSAGRPARTGSWKAWLNGYATTHTDYIYQTVTIPSTSTSATLTFYVRIDTAETTTTTQYDKLQVQISNNGGSTYTTLATYSNLNANSTYTLKSFNLNAYIGQTVRVRFYGTEDSSLQTSFVIDDTALNVQ